MPIEAHFTGVAQEPERWLPFLETLPDLSLHSADDALRAEAKRQGDLGDKELEALFATLAGVCSYYYRSGDRLNPFGPMMEMGASRTAIPEDLRDTDLDEFAEMLPLLTPVTLKARVADVLWIRRRIPEAAAVAVESYLEASREKDEDAVHDAIDQAERSVKLAGLLGNGAADLPAKALQRVREMLDEPSADSLGAQSHLIQILIDSGDEEGLEDCQARAAQRAEAHDSAGEPSDARGWYELASRVADRRHDNAAARQFSIRAAETWVAEADLEVASENPSYMRAAHQLEMAIKVFRRVGRMRQRIDELHDRMLEWQELSHDQLSAFSHSIDLSEYAKASIDRVSGKPFAQAILALAFTYGYRSVESIREQTMRLMRDHPLQYMITRSYLDDRGRVIARPPSMSTSESDDSDAAIQAEMFTQARNELGIAAQGLVLPARQAIIAEHPITHRLILQTLGPSPFIPPGHEPQYARGVYFGFVGDFASAAAVLAPELECALREELMRHEVMLPMLDTYGIHRARQLAELLYSPSTTEFYGPDKVFTLKAVLSSDFGANLRDRVAHGLMSHGELMSMDSVTLWWLAIRLAIEPMVQLVGDDSEPQNDSTEARPE